MLNNHEWVVFLLVQVAAYWKSCHKNRKR